MLPDLILLAGSLGIILLASYLFTNGIELLGSRIHFHQAATGSILAAVGTALPETIIPIIAILLYRDTAAQQIGIGAIVGAPFMLATLAFFVTGAAALVFTAMGRRSRALRIDPVLVARDLAWFLVLYGTAVALGGFAAPRGLRCGVAAALVAGYVLYVRRTLAAESPENEAHHPLLLARLFGVRSGGAWIAVQVIASLAIMTGGAHAFVGAVKALSADLGVSAAVLSILVTPVATELPEKLNSVIWVGQRKDTLAMGNITGAMVFQGAFPVAVGMLFTPWDLHGAPAVSALLAMAGAAVVLAWVRWRRSLSPFVLLAGCLLYALFVAYIVAGSGTRF